MAEFFNAAAIFAVVALGLWLTAVALARMITVSLAVFTILAMLLTGVGEQDAGAPIGLGAMTLCWWMAWQVLHRLRYGWWRSVHLGRGRLRVRRRT